MLSPITALTVLLVLTIVLLAGCASPTPLRAAAIARPFSPNPTPELLASIPPVQVLPAKVEALIAKGERLLDDDQWSPALQVFLEANALAPTSHRIDELILDTAELIELVDD